jgi:hypothetical protein
VALTERRIDLLARKRSLQLTPQQFVGFSALGCMIYHNYCITALSSRTLASKEQLRSRNQNQSVPDGNDKRRI